ncbi:hypothetical protein CBS63078_293 [Aspergillus niger]|nr:hypothetical protein CBS115989_3063 [Aspergillus niger]KAI2846611.1 hypothetical protein CBS11350_3644 [Aspergillus niger]KAI2857208.1 hypothetical protein CBS11232_3284 [Aspergillus niger]KAI2875738.1 hypothetical protein CBS115988_5177 [Aspergillus niger]KAI2887632.1 hypothetical protein CBS11852_7425 [Aspergillus niger]
MPLSYDKLDPSASQIRLLTIIPDENDENPVCGSLHTVSLNDTCDFDALSYVWGDTSVTVDISVDNCIVGVTPNLHAFLRKIRQPNTERTSLPSWVVDFTTTDPKHREKMQQSFSKTMNLDKALWEQSRDHAPIVADDM